MGKCITNADSAIDGVLLTPLKVMDVLGGDVLHGIKCSDHGYSGFGEAYFSIVNLGAVKAWKRHRKMTLNLIVPIGAVRFVIYDDRLESVTLGKFQEVSLSRENYCRLTVPPMLWVGFQGRDVSDSILLNVANIEHQPDEADRKELNEIEFEWES